LSETALGLSQVCDELSTLGEFGVERVDVTTPPTAVRRETSPVVVVRDIAVTLDRLLVAVGVSRVTWRTRPNEIALTQLGLADLINTAFFALGIPRCIGGSHSRAGFKRGGGKLGSCPGPPQKNSTKIIT